MEQVVVRLAVAQKQVGHRVGVLAIHEGPLRTVLHEHGIRAEILGAGRLRRGAKALRFFRSARPDIVHAHNPTSLHYAILSRLVTPARVVVTVHGEINARRGSALEWYLTSAVAVVSHAALPHVRLGDAATRATVVHNGIAAVDDDTGQRESMRRELGMSDTLVGIIVARLSGLKGHATLLRAIASLRDAGTHVLVLIAGDGAQRAALERDAQALSLDDRYVRFLGARSDVDALLRAADFFVLPSDSEGLPMSVLEAMAHGLPVVASHVGGIPELIEAETHGLLVPPGDPKALGAAIRRLADDLSLRRRLGDAGRARASREFSLATTLANYDRLYRRAISE